MPTLSEYVLTEVLHTGPVTTLYRGYQKADHTPVVIKLLEHEYPNPRDLARLRHEYLICRSLDVPGVVRAYGLETVGHGLALVLEDFGGWPLVDVLRRERLAVKTALQIAAALAEAVGAVHDRHIIHKDIKPHNVLINLETGAVKLTDFGIATRLSQETQKEAGPDALEGTLMYMSPEQTGRMNRSLDHRSDLYSLGVTLYEMLTGVLPFSATEPMEIVHSHIARTPPAPHERAPEVPQVVSAIVMKLLSKAAEDRYQSAHGLKADLDECLARLSKGGELAPFSLSQRDIPGALRVAQKLYGREAEVKALFAAFERASAGGAELLLVSGYAGVGKSTLAGEIQKAAGRSGGRFYAGKFDQRSRNVPYAAVLAALRGLIRDLLAAPEETLDRLRRGMLTAVGNNGQLLVDIIPELALLIGPQPPAPALGPAEAQNRFHLVFQRFLGVFADAQHPLVLFLDDLQWADPASLKLLSTLLLDPERGYLLIIGAYRDAEVGPAHPLSLAVEELRKGGARVSELQLRALGLGDVTQLLADTLGCERAKVLPLARVAFDKTLGNPFFLGQLLRSLSETGCIFFDRGARAWAWDLERIRAAEVTDNVVEFMAAKVARLAPATRRALLLAACIGHTFDLKTLSVISETPIRAVALALWDALRERLVLPINTEYRFFAEEDDEGEQGPAPSLMFDVTYRFLHDRVQQAAYSLIEEPRKQAVHLQIGRLLRDQSSAKEREERLFAVVDHLNIGAKLIEDPGELRDLARANLAAGTRAKAATAYQAALGYLDAAAELTGEACFQDDYALAFALYLEQAECAYLTGQFEKAEALFDVLLRRAEARPDRVQVYMLCILLATARGDFAGALRFGRAALAMFDVSLPETEEEQQRAFDAELAVLRESLVGRRIEDEINAPLIADPEQKAKLDLLLQLSPAVFFTGVTIYNLLGTIMINLCLRHGRSELGAFCYAYASQTQAMWLGQHREGRAFFRVACALDEQFDAPALRAKTNVIIVSVGHLFISFREVLFYVARAQRAALETGDLLFLSYTCFHDVMPRLCAGEDLGAISDALHRNFALARKTRSELVLATLAITRQMIAALEGRTAALGSLSDDGYDEAAHRAQIEATAGFEFVLCWMHTVKLVLLYLDGEYEAALAAGELAHATSGATAICHFWTDVPFFLGLTLAALYPSAAADDKARYAAALSEHTARMAAWAESCPANFQHKLLLLKAEAARVAGERDEAEALYDAAIEAARSSEATHHEALASELAARHYLARGKLRIARSYMIDAYHGYKRWGASGKTAALLARNPELLSAATGLSRPMNPVTETMTSNDVTAGLDAASLVRAAQAIASEIELDRLLDRLLRLVVQNAGADRAVLLLVREAGLVVEATMTVDPDIVRVGLSTPLDEDAEVPLSVVQFVERTMDPVVLGDAARGGPFAVDPYLRARPPKSLLCLSMAQQGRVPGMLYLENHAARDAFTPARVEVAGMLLSQAAIAVENALLVAELRGRSEELSSTNAALARANQAMRVANERLEKELRAREHAEIARVEIARELHRVQTPFIPITDQIAVMPLVGTVDAERAAQVLETALRGVAAERARVVILDVTGVKLFDDGVTGTLLSVTRALRLLGAQAVITGIRPEMARAIVEMGVEVSAIVTQGTLQSGIAYAMSRLSVKGARWGRGQEIPPR